MFRISLQYSYHNLLRPAGQAILGTNFSIPGSRFVSCWWGCKGAAEEQQLVSEAFPKFPRTDFRECSIPCTKQLHSHHFTLKASQQTQDNNSLWIQDSYDGFQAEKHAFTLCITYLVPCHMKQSILWNSAAKTTLETWIHPNASWEYRMVHLKMLLPFFRIFTKPRDIPYYMSNSFSTRESVKMGETFFHVWSWLVFSCDCRWS